MGLNIQLEGFDVVREVEKNSSSSTYEAIQQSASEKRSGILEVWTLNHLGDTDLVRFQIDSEKSKQVKNPSLIHCQPVPNESRRFATFFKAFEGRPLKNVWAELSNSQEKLDLKVLLKVGVELCDLLSELHKLGIFHGFLNSTTVWLDQDGKVRITHLGLGSILFRSQKTLYSDIALHQWLPYMSPEQTGRMNRSVDHRTDFYSLGILLYEGLVGQPPFGGEDPLELFHGHIATVPKSPRQVSADIPEVLSDLVMTLLSKSAQDRYQSAVGVRSDLEQCLKALDPSGQISVPIELKKDDYSLNFIHPQKVYGREKEISHLLQDFEKAASGSTQLTVIRGESGMGKSALINELNKPILARRGYFTSGKYDQYMKGRPYSVFTQALQSLFAQVLSESDSQVEGWKERLLEALGMNGQAIIDVIPSLADLIGPQPAISELGPKEVQIRFQATFGKMMHVFATQDSPLVLYLDDLQWIDTASLKLLQFLLTQGDIPYLHVIIAFRSNEVGSDHSVHLLLEELQSSNCKPTSVTLQPIGSSEIIELLTDVLGKRIENLQKLVELIISKTEGNPLLVVQTLEAFYNENVLEFQPRQGWSWKEDQAIRLQDGQSIIQIIEKKLKRLKPDDIEILRVAAHIGNTFGFSILKEVVQKPESVVLNHLLVASSHGIIVQQQSRSGEEFSFVHDRVQETIYSIVDDETRQEYHYQIARVIKLQLERQANSTGRPVSALLDEKIFDLVNQMSFALPHYRTQEERENVIQLNYLAGKKARLSSAYAAAVKYYGIAMDFLGNDQIKAEHPLAFNIIHGLAESTYIIGKDEEAERLFEEGLHNIAKTPLQRAIIYQTRNQKEARAGNSAKAVQQALNGLRELGVHIKEHPSVFDFLKIRLKVGWTLLWKPVEQIRILPEIKSEEERIIQSILNTVSISSYHIVEKNPYLFHTINFNLLIRSLNIGITENVTMALAGYSVYLMGILFNFKRGRVFAELAMEYLERYPGFWLYGRTQYTITTLFFRWLQPGNSAMIKGYQKASQASYNMGDPMFVAHPAEATCYTMLFGDTTLQKVDQEIIQAIEIIRRINSQDRLYHIYCLRRLVAELGGLGGQASSNVEEYLHEIDKTITNLEKSGSVVATGVGKKVVYQTLSKAILSGTEEILDALEKHEHKAAAHISHPLNCEYYFLYALSIIDHLPKLEASRRKKLLSKLKQIRKMVKAWSRSCPENFLYLHYWLEAEVAKRHGRLNAAIEHYLAASTEAKATGTFYFRGMILERHGKFYLELGRALEAKVYIQEARDVYSKWGALKKVEVMETSYSDLHLAQLKVAATAASTSASQTLDLSSVLKASRAISVEVVLPKLLDQVMRLLLENAGAQTGAFIMNRAPRKRGQEANIQVKPQWKLEAFAENVSGEMKIQVLQGIDLEQADNIPRLLVSYVTRSSQSVVLENASIDSRFKSDGYVQTQKLKSALALPIINQGALVGVLYLENNLTTGAFTPERLETLSILSGQAAISIENAILYSDMEEQIRERTKDIRSIMENIRHGIFTFGKDFKVHHDFSKHLFSIFKTENIGGRKFQEFLFQGADVSSDQLDLINAALGLSIGEGSIQWEINFSNLLTEITREKGAQVLQLDWVPIEDQRGDIQKVMLTVRDVTEIRQAELLAQTRQRELDMIGELLGIDGVRLESFLQTSFKDLEQAVELLKESEREKASHSEKDWVQGNLNRSKVLFRYLHTLKGVARTYMLSKVTVSTHEAEEFYSTYLKAPSAAAWEAGKLIGNIETIQSILKEYQDIFRQKLGSRQQGKPDSGQVWKQVFELLEDQRLEELKKIVVENITITLRDILDPILAQIPSLAAKLGKENPTVQWDGENLRFRPEIRSKLEGVFTHIIGNAMDHGLQANQKGSILLKTEPTKRGYAIKIQDSGRGLPLHKLREKGTKASLVQPTAPDEEVGMLIFQSGLSTAEKVTDVSGRGVGMDAVKSMIEELGGQVSIQFQGPSSPEGFRPFQLILDFPQETFFKSNL